MNEQIYTYINSPEGELNYSITETCMKLAVCMDELIRSNGYTLDTFATEMEVDVDTVKLWLSGTYDFELALLQRIFNKLGTELKITITNM